MSEIVRSELGRPTVRPADTLPTLSVISCPDWARTAARISLARRAWHAAGNGNDLGPVIRSVGQAIPPYGRRQDARGKRQFSCSA
jgi:hypothetical protein